MKSFFEYIRQYLFAIVLVVLIGGFVALAVANRASTPSKNDIKISGLKAYSITDRSHVNERVSYGQTPPAGGNHAPVWAGCDGKVYEAPLQNENAVHSLEHGAVWITYKPAVGQAAVDQLKGQVVSSNYTFMSPFEGQSGPIVLTAWDNQLTVDKADDPRVDQFLQKFRLGPQTPEPGATCIAPQGGGM